MRVQLNWVPEPEFGGIYQAKIDGSFEKNGLDVDITPGGAGAPTWQLVAGGKVDFAVASADEVIIARQQKADVVAIFATYQTCPQGIMVHASRGLKSLVDLFSAGGKLAVEPGLPYVNYLQQKYGAARIELVSYDGGIGNFLRDKNLAQQCFITSEPIAAKRAGSDPQVFLIADAGYNPYTAVIITRGKFAQDHAALVQCLVAALRAGWSAYLADPAKANDAMAKLNPDMDHDTFNAASAAQKPLIETDETKKNGLGWMSLERWTELGKQLVGLKVIDAAPDAKTCFIAPK
ncbi:MAG: ABC transporter substrate-binding protein [Phycisphaerae bacterium]|nr:ABC transporter substrate-binding protein [Phycisphaerae bacterium]